MFFSFNRNLERLVFIVVGIIIYGIINFSSIGINAQDDKGEVTDRGSIFFSIVLNKVSNDKIYKQIESLRYLIMSREQRGRGDFNDSRDSLKMAVQSASESLELHVVEMVLMGSSEALTDVNEFIDIMKVEAKKMIDE